MLVVLYSACGVSCSREEPGPAKKSETSLGADEREPFRNEVRQAYNKSKFAELEATAAEVRTGKAKFADGSWKLLHFYQALECRESEPESMWKLHEKIHQDWQKAFPKSVTAKVARADFLTSYAWHARGKGYAKKVTAEGWKLFGARLDEALKILDGCKSSAASYPRWSSVRMRIGLGQAMPKKDYLTLFRNATDAEPTYFDHDLQLAHYLLPRWYGNPGDWEAAAEAEITRPGGLGHETYARVVQSQVGYYDNIFKQSKASWRKARKGFEEMRARNPGSTVILNLFCRMAWLADDRELAKNLFGELGTNYEQSSWRSRKEFDGANTWATGG